MILRFILKFILNDKIDWVNTPFEKDRINSYQISYKLSFPEVGWAFTITKIDNSTNYRTNFSYLTQEIVKIKFEEYRDIIKILTLPRVIVLGDGTPLNTFGFKMYILKNFT